MTERLALLVWTATPDHPELAVTPLIHALAARALDAEVEIHFAGPAVRWLVAGVADAAWPTAAREKSVGAYLADVAAEGVPLYACSMAAAQWMARGETLLPQVRHAGATAFVARALDPGWRSLTY